MPAEIPSKFGTSTALTITLASLANGAGRQATAVQPGTPAPPRVLVFGKITAGTLPTANSLLSFYLSRADDDATAEHRDGGAGAADAAWPPSGTLTDRLDELDQVHGITFSGDTGREYTFSFFLNEPGPDWVLIVVNETGKALDATGSNHYIRYRTIVPESQ